MGRSEIGYAKKKVTDFKKKKIIKGENETQKDEVRL